MELNSVEDVKALTEYQKIDQIQRIEKKIHRLSFIPFIGGLMLLLYSFWLIWSGINSLSPAHLIVVASFVASIGHSNVQRTDLIKHLFELKYGK
ncbi:hypothetical protein [Thalassotalea sp. G2M2-11]|uniref:hypothetical protein n=1 Tax=Thalassotalea sp. G2M2-11 TaxID=2787627 RepID=UPI0019D04A4D|nr:hypothetical protein [Thalassotalea sp. G2M2-11]